MSDTFLRKALIRLAHTNPELREHLLPLLRSSGVRRASFQGTQWNSPEAAYLGGMRGAEGMNVDRALSSVPKAIAQVKKTILKRLDRIGTYQQADEITQGILDDVLQLWYYQGLYDELLVANQP